MRVPGSFVLPISALLLSSCGVVKLPVRVVGAVAEGTARAGKKAYDSSAAALTKSEEEKAAEAREEALEEARARKKEPADDPEPAPAAGDSVPVVPDDPAEYLPPLPGTSEPLPDDMPLPYEP